MRGLTKLTFTLSQVSIELPDLFRALCKVIPMPCKRLFDFSYLSGKIGGRFVAKLNDLFLDHFEEFEHFLPCDRVLFRLQIEFRVRCSVRGGTTKTSQKARQVFLCSLRHVGLPSSRVSNRASKNQ